MLLRRDRSGPVAERVDVLAELPIFAGVARRDLRRLAESASEVRFEPGQEMLAQGRIGTDAFVLVEGEAESRGGDVVGIIHAGEVVGEMALVDRQPRSTTVVARTPVRAYALHARDLQRLIDKRPQVQKALLETMSRRLRGVSGGDNPPR